MKLLGVTVLWMCAKFEETLTPYLVDFVFMTNGACKRNAILNMELKVMETIQFKMCVMNPLVLLTKSLAMNVVCTVNGIEEYMPQCSDVKRVAAYVSDLYVLYATKTSEYEKTAAAMELLTLELCGYVQLDIAYGEGVQEELDFLRRMHTQRGTPEIKIVWKKHKQTLIDIEAHQSVFVDIPLCES